MPIHCPECRFEFPEGMHPLPNQCPRCGAPLYFAREAPAPAPRPRRNYGFLKHSPTAAIIILCIIAYLAEVIVSRSIEISLPALMKLGANSGVEVFSGQWWRLMTSVFLHGGFLHIAANMWALFNLGLLAEILYGRRNYLVLYLLCGLGGSVASVWWHPTEVGVGASGAIFGIAGALLPALKFQKNPRIAMALRGALGSIVFFVFVNLLIGAGVPFIDNAAHVGGLVTGIVVGALLPSYTVEEERKKTGQAIVVFVSAFALLAYGATYAKKKYEPKMLRIRAVQLIRAGKTTEAMALYQQALKNRPNDEALAVEYGTLLDQLKKYPEEIEVVKQLSAQHPKDARYLAALCGAYVKNQEAPNAVAPCRKALELDPKNQAYLFTLGSVYLDLKQTADAVATFRKAYELKPEGFGENFFLGLALLEDGQKPEAAERLRKAVQLNPTDVPARRALKVAETP
ncbi:MAG: rhomboid family intramembrane serine protease [Acidobacteriaceae bacterium]